MYRSSRVTIAAPAFRLCSAGLLTQAAQQEYFLWSTWRASLGGLAGPVWASQLASDAGQAGCQTMITCLAALGAKQA